MNAQFDIKRINMLKDILIRLRHEESWESVQAEVDQYFKDVSVVEILLIEQELINGDYGITIEDVVKLSRIHPHLYGITNSEIDATETNHPGHPVQIFKNENIIFQTILNQINQHLVSLEQDLQNFQVDSIIEKIKHQIYRLGEFHKHYNRKEKLFFPIMERYGHYSPTRIMWRGDDRIRALYKGIKGLSDQLPHVNINHVQKTYETFEREFRAMIFQEEAIILPILLSIFHRDDWVTIARESDAFGYAITEPIEKWMHQSKDVNLDEGGEESKGSVVKNIGIGGNITVEEANLILNNLPLEITFVDKNNVFKYFNEMTEASEMMLVRTPISIGRNVANCHPPKSLKKVMALIRDLKTKKRTSESMWFKKKDQYVHITYKGIFNEEDEFLGFLEYVQDIQPFFDLPTEVKTGLSKLGE